MKLILFFTMILICLVFNSAKAHSSAPISPKKSLKEQPKQKNKVAKKPNFFQRLAIKILQKKIQRAKEGKKLHWAAMTSFVCGILGFFFLAIPFGIYALGKIKKNPEYAGELWAIMGLVFGILVFLLYALAIVIFLSMWG